MTTDPHAGAELTDDALQGEIELVGDLVVAASGSEGPLSDDEIDAALGIARYGPGDGAHETTDEDSGADSGNVSGSGSGNGHGAAYRASQGASRGQRV
jgi:hypothetical protein